MSNAKKKTKKAGLLMKVRSKQIQAIRNVGECRSEEEALIKAGYSQSYAKSGRIKDTATWQELMEEYLPDSLLTAKHKALIEKQEVIVRNNVSTKEIEVLPTGQIDVQAVKAGLDMAYKLKKRYEDSITIKGELRAISDEEIEGRIAGIISRAIGAIGGTGKKKS